MQESSITRKSIKTDEFIDNEGVSINGTMAGRKLQVAEIMEKLGEFGRLHYQLLIWCILISLATTANQNAIAFVMQDPVFFCKDDIGGFYECTQERACKNVYGYRLEYDKESIIIDHRLYCDQRWMKIWGESIIFIASSVLSTLLMFIIERFGRKTVFFVVTILTFVFNVILLLSKNYWTVVTCFTMLWALSYLYNTNFYVYSTEVFNGKWRSIANSAFFFFNNVFKIIYVLLCFTISDYKGNYWIMFMLGVLFLPLVFFIVETPYHFHRVGNVKALKENLEYFNAVNNKGKLALIEDNNKIIAHSLKVEALTQQQLVDVSTQEISRKSKKAVFNDKLTLCNYIFHLTLITITIVPNYVASALTDTIPTKLGISNIYISSIAFAVVYIISNFILIFTLHKIPRKKGNIIIILLLVILSIVLLSFSIIGIHHAKATRWTELGLTMIGTGLRMAQFLLIQRYVNEVFPTKLRAISIAIVLEIGRSSMFIGNLFDVLADKTDVHPFVYMGTLCLLTLPCFWRYEETLNKPTKN